MGSAGGWITGVLVAAAAVGALSGAVVFYLRRVWFYRDPRRTPPTEPGALLAPCDGKVVYVHPFAKGLVASRKLGRRVPLEEIAKDPAVRDRDGWLIGIYMSPLDVHFNYAPLAGVARRVARHAASVNWPMVDLWEYVNLTYLRRAVDLFAHRHHLANERTTIFIQGDGVEVAMVEIADKFVNKIRLFIGEGERVAAGQKVSFIERGSQVDLAVFDPAAEVAVRPGQQVYGALTVIARSPGAGGREDPR